MAKDIVDGGEGTPASGKPDWALSRRERRRAERARQGLPPPWRKWPWVVLVVLVAAGAAGWLNREVILARLAPPAEEPAQAAAASDAPRLTQINQTEWAVIEPQTLRRTVRVIGSLRPSRQSDLAAESAGQVEAVLARPGDRVGEGDLLVQVDVEGLTLDVDLARNNAEATRSELTLAEGRLERQRALSERGVAAEASLDEAESNVVRLRASLAAQEEQVAVAERALEGAAVRAPFDGVIASRSVEAGNVVGAGTPLLTIVDLSRMEMLAQAPIAAGANLRPGQRVELRVDGVRGQSVEGVVDRIAPVAEEGTRTLTVYVMIDNDEELLLGGMFATGEIVVAEAEEALAVPREAVRNEDGDYVLVIEDGVLVRRDVTLGEEWGGGLVQVEGLEPGAQVVTAALGGLEPSQAVELVEF
jgi:RND family efflux transporter MFP subunit